MDTRFNCICDCIQSSLLCQQDSKIKEVLIRKTLPALILHSAWALSSLLWVFTVFSRCFPMVLYDTYIQKYDEKGTSKYLFLKLFFFFLNNTDPREIFCHIYELSSIKLSCRNIAKEWQVISTFPPSQTVVLIIPQLVFFVGFCYCCCCCLCVCLFFFLLFFSFFTVILTIALAIMEPLYAMVTLLLWHSD